ncbi:alpha/beta hydrolase [Sphaerisporangium sp. NPDC051011]|uniref:alpha/beta fold hydrolase n=1 Tax=Sphaerisporangium sp. NPDC051011 TaxID=3155792 RepID=UPI0033E9A1F5
MKLWTAALGDGAKTAALIHGFTADSGIWFEFAPWLAGQGYTVTLVDLRGHGQSPRAESYGYWEIANDLVDTLPTGLDLVIGHSLGGRLLGHVVDRLRPAKAVYLDPAWTIPEGETATILIHEDGSPITADELAVLMPTRSPAQHRQIVQFTERFDLTMFHKADGGLADFDPPQTPVVPSLLVLADPSAYVPTDLQERLRDGGYVVRVVPGGLHDLQLDNLTATEQALADWL